MLWYVSQSPFGSVPVGPKESKLTLARELVSQSPFGSVPVGQSKLSPGGDSRACLNRLSALSRSDKLRPSRATPSRCLNRLSALSRSDGPVVSPLSRFTMSQSPFGSVPVGRCTGHHHWGGTRVSIAFRLCPGRTLQARRKAGLGDVSIAFRLCPGRTSIDAIVRLKTVSQSPFGSVPVGRGAKCIH